MYRIFYDKFIDMFVDKLPEFCSPDPRWESGGCGGEGVGGFTALLPKPPDGLPPYRTGSGGCSVRGFPIDIFPFCRERTKEPVAL